MLCSGESKLLHKAIRHDLYIYALFLCQVSLCLAVLIFVKFADEIWPVTGYMLRIG